MGVDKLNFVWDLVISELTLKHVNSLDQKNLAIICKTVADNQLKTSVQFWLEANKRFIILENELDLRNFSWLVYGFVHSNNLSAEGFV